MQLYKTPIWPPTFFAASASLYFFPLEKFLSPPPDIMDFSIDPPKLKSLTSLFFGKKEKKQSSMQVPPPPPLEPGLKTLTIPTNHNRSLSCKKPNILSFSSASSSSSSPSSLSSLSSPPSPTPSTSSSITDVKECNDEKEAVVEKKKPQMSSFRRRRSSFQEEREFPPPIPHLARTGNLPCHMPWVLKRSYTDNGRLVIQEVKVKHHEYFRAHRANGRLTLQIIQLDESATELPSRPPSPNDSLEMTENSPSSSPPSSPSSTEEAEDKCDNVKINVPTVLRSNLPPLSTSSLPPRTPLLSKELKDTLNVNRGCSPQDVTEMGTLPSILSSTMPESSLGIGVGSGGGGGGGGCCVNKRSPTLFSTPIPTIRPVHS